METSTAGLSERRQRVVVDGEHSSDIHVASGVPQGTVFISRQPYNLKCDYSLTTVLYRPINSPADQIALEQDLASLTQWADTWAMQYNPQKCFILTISPKKDPPQHLYSICGCVLSQVSDTKYLGITISNDLQWERHIITSCTKASRMIGFLRRNLSRCPRQLRELAYFTLVRSRVEYGISHTYQRIYNQLRQSNEKLHDS